jgi:hypothetical protein
MHLDSHHIFIASKKALNNLRYLGLFCLVFYLA